MKLIGVFAVLFALSASAQTTTGITRAKTVDVVCAGSPCSGSAPALATDGIALQDGTAIRVRLCASSGEDLSGAGSLAVYVYDANDGLWSLVPDLEKEVSANASGERCIGFAEGENGVPFGRVAYVPVGVTLSGGDLAIKTYVATLRRP